MKLSRLQFFILPTVYLCVGGVVTALLCERIINYAATSWLVLLLPMLMVTVLLTVVGVVNVWLQYRTEVDAGLRLSYGGVELGWLYFKCWAVVMAGLMLGVLFTWLCRLLPAELHELFAVYRWAFYLFCMGLTLAALMSVVLGVNLEEVRLRNAQTENQLLKAQLNPHFLYNTLNNIDALIWLDQERASAAVTSLSDLMRYMTYSARQEKVPLSDEVRAIGQLCDLQRLRLTDPSSLVFETSGYAEPHGADVVKWEIAPLLLIPLVENCFKHCGSTTEARAICIRVEADDHRLMFSTDNNLPPSDNVEAGQKGASVPHGVGLTVLRRRLELLYHGHYSFEAKREGQRFRTMLTISDLPRQ